MTSSHHCSTTACWLAGNRLRYFLAAILSLRGKLGCAVWKLLTVALDKLSLLTASHHYRFHDVFQSSQLSMLKQHLWTHQLCGLPVITIVPMMTSSHHHCSHDDFQSSQVCPRWSSTCADCQSSLLFPWWLPVITIVPMMTYSHHNSRAVSGGIGCPEPPLDIPEKKNLAAEKYCCNCWKTSIHSLGMQENRVGISVKWHH